jgi:hypothetical protein
MAQRGRNGKSKRSGEAEAATKGAKILEIVAGGATIKEAAAIVGVSPHWAGQLYIRELQAVTDKSGQLRRFMLAQDLETLRQLIKAHMPLAVGEALALDKDGYVQPDATHVNTTTLITRTPDYQSAKIVLSALDRRAKLLGLDAAIRVEVSSTRVNEAVDDIEKMIDDADDASLADVLELDARRMQLPHSG